MVELANFDDQSLHELERQAARGSQTDWPDSHPSGCPSPDFRDFDEPHACCRRRLDSPHQRGNHRRSGDEPKPFCAGAGGR